MGAWRNLPGLVSALLLLNVMFAHALFADDVASQHQLRLTVLSADSHALNSGTPVPKDCDLQNFSAYCNESKNPTGQSVIVVRDADGRSYTIACTVDSHWSKCGSLAVGETYEARKDKHGITVFYRDAKGKERKQLYQLVASVSAPQSGAAANPQPQVAAPPQNSPAPTPAPHVAAPVRNSPAAAPVPPPVAAPGVLKEKVRCKFSSTPSGADIIIDGKYVGNTPSEIGVRTGTHVVVISMPGFAEWKRELTVAADSLVNVTASLQKAQP